MSPALILRWLPLVSQVVDLVMHIRERRQEGMAARRKAAAKACPSPAPAKAKTGAKQAPRKDGKR